MAAPKTVSRSHHLYKYTHAQQSDDEWIWLNADCCSSEYPFIDKETTDLQCHTRWRCKGWLLDYKIHGRRLSSIDRYKILQHQTPRGGWPRFFPDTVTWYVATLLCQTPEWQGWKTWKALITTAHCNMQLWHWSYVNDIMVMYIYTKYINEFNYIKQ